MESVVAVGPAVSHMSTVESVAVVAALAVAVIAVEHLACSQDFRRHTPGPPLRTLQHCWWNILLLVVEGHIAAAAAAAAGLECTLVNETDFGSVPG